MGREDPRPHPKRISCRLENTSHTETQSHKKRSADFKDSVFGLNKENSAFPSSRRAVVRVYVFSVSLRLRVRRCIFFIFFWFRFEPLA